MRLNSLLLPCCTSQPDEKITLPKKDQTMVNERKNRRNKNTSEATPEVAPIATPEVAPEATPEVAPIATPEVAPEVNPEQGSDEPTTRKTRKNYLKDKTLLFTPEQIEDARKVRDSINAEMESDEATGTVRLYRMTFDGQDYLAIGRHSGETAALVFFHLGGTDEQLDAERKGPKASPEVAAKRAGEALTKLSPEEQRKLMFASVSKMGKEERDAFLAAFMSNG